MKWIKIKDTQPPEDLHILIYCREKSRHGTNFIAIGSVTQNIWFYDNCQELEEHIYKVTHWMPLPPEPKN